MLIIYVDIVSFHTFSGAYLEGGPHNRGLPEAVKGGGAKVSFGPPKCKVNVTLAPPLQLSGGRGPPLGTPLCNFLDFTIYTTRK